MVDADEVLNRRVRALEIQRDRWKARWSDLSTVHAATLGKLRAAGNRAEAAERRERDLARSLEDLRHRLREGRRDVV